MPPALNRYETGPPIMPLAALRAEYRTPNTQPRAVSHYESAPSVLQNMIPPNPHQRQDSAHLTLPPSRRMDNDVQEMHKVASHAGQHTSSS
ncbi:hypothetical protein AC579_5501 [Pseudocercospora musae]|uniref:Uncharacterized protein n=1 Tax=Pseudocercospora musae TaxID=113226 RepID=A0A139IPU9_9PEZI|nr:hypothetical protein AC579_5501 [Pseudocercospora musae]